MHHDIEIPVVFRIQQFGQPFGQQFAQPFAQPEYPKPGSEATCDSCGTVVTRFFHCQDCQEDVGGLFDLCPGCWYAHRCRQSHRALLASPLSYAHMMCYP